VHVADTQQMTSTSGITGSLSPPTAQSSGLNAIAAGARKLDADAQQVANTNGADDTAPLVDLNQALLLAQAGADVISTEDKMLGSLFDAFG
jgi:hypothetical protein